MLPGYLGMGIMLSNGTAFCCITFEIKACVSDYGNTTEEKP